jgi:hypothetical protein
MGYEDHSYHLMRERHCRTMARLASDPEVRRRHEQLAELHASRVIGIADFAQPANSDAAVF